MTEPVFAAEPSRLLISALLIEKKGAIPAMPGMAQVEERMGRKK